MSAVKRPGMVTASRVANQLDISTKTLISWYKFYESDLPKPDNMPELPPYEQAYFRAPRYWREEDIPKLITFKEWVPKGKRGVMGEINVTCWTKAYVEKRKQRKLSERQERILEKKLKKEQEEKLVEEILHHGE
jgi:hypothetical protein